MYENMHNQHKNQPLNRLLEAWQTLPQPLRLLFGMLGGVMLLTLIKQFLHKLVNKAKAINGSRTVENADLTVQIAPSEPFTPTVDEKFSDDVTEDEIQQELIRMTMSELGKRSGKARRRKVLE